MSQQTGPVPGPLNTPPKRATATTAGPGPTGEVVVVVSVPPAAASAAPMRTPPEYPGREVPSWVILALHHRLLPRCVGGSIGRLLAEFPGVDGNAVASAVIGAYRDLQGNPGPTLPELVERSARERLPDMRRPAGACPGVVRGAPDRDVVAIQKSSGLVGR